VDPADRARCNTDDVIGSREPIEAAPGAILLDDGREELMEGAACRRLLEAMLAFIVAVYETEVCNVVMRTVAARQVLRVLGCGKVLRTREPVKRSRQ
jgi:hypothetical protein